MGLPGFPQFLLVKHDQQHTKTNWPSYRDSKLFEVPMVQKVQKVVDVPQIEVEEQVVEVPVAKHVQVPMIQKVQKIVETWP